MRRYLAGKICSKDDFGSVDKEVYFDINYKKLTETLLTKIESEMCKEKIVKDLNLNDESFQKLNNIPFTLESMLDIWSEVYFKVLYVLNKKERLFLDEKRITICYENSEKVISNSDVNERMKNTINNKKNSKVSIEGQIFDMKDLKSTRKDTEIDTFGVEIVRLWLQKKDFRKLFNITEVRHEKYDSRSILETLHNEINREESYFILEKCLGLQLEYYLEIFIVKKFPQIEYKQLEEIINVLCEYEAIGIRIHILYLMNQALSTCQYTEQKEHKMDEYCKWLHVLVPKFQMLYTYAVDAILDEYKKYYSLGTILDIVEDKRNEVERLKKFRIQPMTDFLKIDEVKSRIQDVEKKIKMQDEASSIIQDIEEILGAEIGWFERLEQYRFVCGLPDFVFGLPNGGYYLNKFEYREKIQALIVQKSYEKYSNKAG